jgi:2-oxo-4-hydroxy-4-carboxy-5-ureidoimidazoline decarboxylase
MGGFTWPMSRMHSLAQLNSLSCDKFVRIIGPVFEGSPWIAGAAWQKRPFANLEELHRRLCEGVQNAGEEKQLALIRAHPDLVGRAALAGALTAASTAEQASAGLDRLTSEGIATFQTLNKAYHQKFGFPFVICARLNKKDAILNGFRLRLKHSRQEELKAALEEISKIAYLRLQDIVGE